MVCCSSKSRLEEINEIIARSQVRAQQIIAAGSFCSQTVVTATMASSAAPVAVSSNHQTPLVEHSNCQMSADRDAECNSVLTTNNEYTCHLISGDAGSGDNR